MRATVHKMLCAWAIKPSATTVILTKNALVAIVANNLTNASNLKILDEKKTLNY